jgi:hypothetical protein
MLYLKRMFHFAKYDAALQTFEKLQEKDGIYALKRHSNGVGTLYELSETPMRPGQEPYDLSGCMVNVTRG